MHLHEHEAKEILAHYAIPIPDFGVATSRADAEKIVRMLSLSQGIVKVQVHAGGRGKAGGVHFAKSAEEVVQHAGNMIGMKIVNAQTGPEGVIAHKVLIARPISIKKEYYLGAVIDRERAQAVLIVSPDGGVDIEEVADKRPDRVMTVPIQLDGTVKMFYLLRIAKFMGWHEEVAKAGMQVVAGIAKAFIEKDAAMIEVNPFVEDTSGRMWAVDAKMSIDDNALYRQPECSTCYDATQQSKHEVAAKEHDLAYIALEGDIGCMVNGAGLAMATMDIIHHYGGKPANFLDVGGSASKEKVAAGFRILLSHPHVKAILVNIFGGIMNCAVIAEGILAAAADTKIAVPLVVRLEGTDVEDGKKLLQKARLDILTADTLEDAAEKVVIAARSS